MWERRRKRPNHRTQAQQASAQCADPWGEVALGSPGAPGPSLHFLCIGLWSVGGGWPSVPVLPHCSQIAFFQGDSQKKMTFIKACQGVTLVGGREGGVCLWKQAKKRRKTWREGKAFKPQNCCNSHGEMAVGLRTATPCSAAHPHQHILTGGPSFQPKH